MSDDEVEQIRKELSAATEKARPLRKKWEAVADEFLVSDKLKRPITFADLIFALAVINEIAQTSVRNHARLLGKQNDFDDGDSPFNVLEHWILRESLLDLYFSHCDVNKPDSEAFHKVWGDEYEAMEEAEAEVREAARKLRELRKAGKL